jgi:peroxiredoxin
LKEKGVEFVACVSVNDIFVMHAWGESLKATAHMEFIGDGNAGFSKALGLTHDYSAHFMGLRSLRFALIVQADLTVSYVAIDSNGYGKTSAEAILTQL